MNFRSIFLVSLSIAAVLAAPGIEVKLGSLSAGKTCSTPLECIDPLYCLIKGDNVFKCDKKACSSDAQCRIGQFCSTASVCEVKSCDKNTKCPGQTVCKPNGKCSVKGLEDDACSSDEECWSGNCKKDKCARGGNIVSRNLRRLTGGGIVGIIFGILLLIGIIALVLFLIRKVKERNANK